MRTSDASRDPAPATLPARLLETTTLAAACALVPELLRPHGVVLPEPHPGWIAVLILSARYGPGGFLAGVAATVAAIGIGAALAGTGAAAALSRIGSQADLYAIGAGLLVSWVAAVQLRRQAEMRERIRALSDRAAAAENAVPALRDTVAALRARVDRTSASLSFLRDAATRLEGSDPVIAAEGAADLALVRTGASAVAVHAGVGALRRQLAARDLRHPGIPAPPEGHGVNLHVPIRSGDEQVGGILVSGILPSAIDPTTMHDLSVIASWCGPAVAGAREARAAASVGLLEPT
jgi:uncharacterized coiled-coil protein SlyX